MKHLQRNLVASAVALSALSAPQVFAAETIVEALKGGTAYGDFRLRHESVEQDNAVDDASALTLRTKLGYKTGSVNGFSAVVEFEDSRIVLGQDEFTVGPTGFNPGEYSVIPDPETTELDQAYVQYKSGDLTAKVGRQVITLDGHRFVGHVGWRQDWQTFDAARVMYKASDTISLDFTYIDQRNRIFAEETDANSSDFLANAAFKTPIGKVVAYSYLLDDETLDTELDTFGVSLKGSVEGDFPILYGFEYAAQSVDKGAVDADVDYLMWSLGTKIAGFTVKVGQELFSAEDGANFATPLATLHKFQGWNDIFLGGTFNPTGNLSASGLEDTVISVAGKVGPGKLVFMYHDFQAAESVAADDFGDEIDIQYTMTFGKNYYAGIKYGAYSEGDTGVDTDKLWVWGGIKF